MPSPSRGGGPAAMPKYQRIAAELRAELDRRAHDSGVRLPSERELAARYGVNRQTVRAALQELRADGLIVTGRRGTRAVGIRAAAPGAPLAPSAPGVHRHPAGAQDGPLPHAAAAGARAGGTVTRLTLVTVPPSLAALLGMSGGARTLVHHRRVHGPRGEALQHAVTYICPRTAARTPELAPYLDRSAAARDEDLRPLHRWLERAAARGRTAETITMTRTSRPDAPAAACGLSVRRLLHDASGRLVAVTDLAFPTWDRLTFHRRPEAIGFRVS
ncbi:GntR family transcriptional regulator [Streptomyces sp. SPB4]|uniref:GntR family transcriptional regulator n=1 Tax=Streptomyces sp. SPB4 TaxID=2940553 RepID=UPI002473CEAC|nr:GntR family transcriptional regulator [Streptomyces sp. SPB4]MDH6543566.1 DNA-binding GntR family transcriptional regulator [Streptomyces sp. SPB4]